MSHTASHTQLRLRALSAAMDARGICILHQASDHRVDLAEYLPDIWPLDKVVDGVEADFMPEPVATQFSAAIGKCLDQGEEQTIEFELPDGAATRTYRARAMPDDDGVLTIISDITQERSREIALAALLREVSHRSKNLLAIVQSVAMQTAHHSGDIGDFLTKFRGRLHALSSTQDLVTESDWRGSHLHALVASQLARLGQSASKNVRITGEDPLLGPNASLHIGLAIHELAANAVSHGGLATARKGNVSVHASYKAEGAAHQNLVIEWQETGMQAARPRQQPRFGTLVLERIVPLSVSGAAVYALEDDRLTYRLSVPADQFQI